MKKSVKKSEKGFLEKIKPKKSNLIYWIAGVVVVIIFFYFISGSINISVKDKKTGELKKESLRGVLFELGGDEDSSESEESGDDENYNTCLNLEKICSMTEEEYNNDMGIGGPYGYYDCVGCCEDIYSGLINSGKSPYSSDFAYQGLLECTDKCNWNCCEYECTENDDGTYTCSDGGSEIQCTPNSDGDYECVNEDGIVVEFARVFAKPEPAGLGASAEWHDCFSFPSR